MHRRDAGATEYDLALIIRDGLSAHAEAEHAAPFLAVLLRRLRHENWSLAPLTIVRLGLRSPDSMGLYLTWTPQVGLTDASRNCICNVRPAGLDVEGVAARLHYLLCQARRRQLSGVQLKYETDAHQTDPDVALPAPSFLLPGPAA